MASTDSRRPAGALAGALPVAHVLARRFGLNRLLWVVNLALAVALAWMIWGLAKPASSRPSGAPRATQPPARPADPSVAAKPPDYTAIMQRNLFGTAPAPGPAAAPAAPAEAGPTQLQLRLLGTIAGGPAFARAIIEDAAKAQNLYRVNETVQGAKIIEIQRNRVILQVGNRRETLELASGSTAASGPEAEGPRAVAPPKAVVPREAVRVMSPTEFEINKRALLARIGGLETIMANAKLEPYVVDGQPKGLRLTGIEGVTMAAFIGIQNGDVITSVNGQELTSMQKAYQVFQKARSQPQLDVQLLRGEQVKALQFKLTSSE
jgi:general secretion pathway protein C